LGQQLVEDDPEGVLIGPAVHLLALELFGGQVAQLTLHFPGFPTTQLVFGGGDAEVHHFGQAVQPDHHVLRADVPVHDLQGVARLVGGPVGVEQAQGRVVGDRRRQPLGQPLFGQLGGLRQNRQIGAADVLHGQEVHASIFTDVVDRHHVGVVEPGRGAGLVEELSQKLGLFGDVGLQALQHHQAVEAGGARLPGQEDIAHPSRGQAPNDLVFIEDVEAGGHGVGSTLLAAEPIPKGRQP
jgi:hypothetical protein